MAAWLPDGAFRYPVAAFAASSCILGSVERAPIRLIVSMFAAAAKAKPSPKSQY